MATKIKLMRLGKTRAPYYRIVVADARTRRNGRAIETIGKYHPKRDPSFMEVESDRALYWLGVGAQPTEAVEAILKVTGDWQKFKGLPAPEPMRTAAPKADRRAIFEQAAKEASTDDSSSGAPDTPRKKRPAKLEPKADAEPKSGADSKSGGDSKSGADPRADADSSTTTSGTSGPSGPSAAEATPDAGADSPPAASGAGAATTDSTPAASGAGAATTDSTPAASGAGAATTDSTPAPGDGQ